MLVFNEGLPRSGKSYDVVKNHILPALAQGRRVFARLNGLDEPEKRNAIAAYLQIPALKLADLLIHVPTAEVKEFFSAVKNPAGEWVIPDKLHDSLCVVDECHTFYVAGREAIDPAIEEFFALIGQNGGDVVLMTQWYRRLHSSVRGRVERKNVFQKLTAVGMDGKYTVARYHATAPERFEKVTTDTETYEPEIFPLYRGYSEKSKNRGVYKSGGQTVWRKIAKYAIFVVPVVAFAVYQVGNFFSGDSGLARSSAPVASRPVQPVSALPAGQVFRDTAGTAQSVVEPHHAKMNDGQSYVFDLVNKGRPRLAGLITMPGLPALGVIEWRQGEGSVVDRLDLAQIRDLGVVVEVHSYGVRLVVGKDVQVVTSWPLDVPEPSPDQSRHDDGQGRAVASTSATDSTRWHDRPTAREYVPPELVQGPGLSSYTGH